jgi:hypothetical protein
LAGTGKFGTDKPRTTENWVDETRAPEYEENQRKTQAYLTQDFKSEPDRGPLLSPPKKEKSIEYYRQLLERKKRARNTKKLSPANAQKNKLLEEYYKAVQEGDKERERELYLAWFNKNDNRTNPYRPSSQQRYNYDLTWDNSKPFDQARYEYNLKKAQELLRFPNRITVAERFHADLQGRTLPSYPELSLGKLPPIQPNLSQLKSQSEVVAKFREVAHLDLKPDTTTLYYENQHGYQVSYKGRNGDTYLWYPGNNVIVRGQWESRAQGKIICFRHFTRGRNPVTGIVGTEWWCTSTENYEPSAFIAGDVFGLSRRKAVPHTLYRCKPPKVFEEQIRALKTWGSNILEC